MSIPGTELCFLINSKNTAITIKAMLCASTYLYYDGDTLREAQVKSFSTEDNNHDRDGKQGIAYYRTVVDESVERYSVYRVYTYTVEVGVSHTESEFDRCIGYYYTISNTVISCYQMLF